MQFHFIAATNKWNSFGKKNHVLFHLQTNIIIIIIKITILEKKMQILVVHSATR